MADYSSVQDYALAHLHRQVSGPFLSDRILLTVHWCFHLFLLPATVWIAEVGTAVQRIFYIFITGEFFSAVERYRLDHVFGKIF